MKPIQHRSFTHSRLCRSQNFRPYRVKFKFILMPVQLLFELNRCCYMNIAFFDRGRHREFVSIRLFVCACWSGGKMLLPEINFQVDEYHTLGTAQHNIKPATTAYIITRIHSYDVHTTPFLAYDTDTIAYTHKHKHTRIHTPLK